MNNNFLWGGGFSAPQTEGIGTKKSLSVWDYWFMESVYLFEEGIYVRNDFIKHYEEDVAFAKQLNFNCFALSIQWTFLIPDGKTINLVAVEFYNKLIDKVIALGMKPIVSLFHFDMPLWLSEKGGWTTKESIVKFSYYAEKCFKLFGSRVHKWITFNEPMQDLLGQYVNSSHYPAENNIVKMLQSVVNIILAHKNAVNIFKTKKLKTKIGIGLNLEIAYPVSDKLEDKEAANIANVWEHQLLLNAFIDNKIHYKLLEIAKKYKIELEITCEEEQSIKDWSIDFLNLIYKNSKIVKANLDHTEFNFGYDIINKNKKLINDDLFNSLMIIKNSYNNIETIVSIKGIGMADERLHANDSGVVEDQYRINYLKNQIIAVKKAIRSESNCQGLIILNYIDNWNWTKSYKERYGLISLDLKQNLRIPKKSFFWLKDFLD